MNLSGKNVYLSKLSASDAEDICRGAGKREISRYTLNIPYPYRKQDADRFIRRSQRQWREKKGYVFGIHLQKGDKLVGVIDLTDIDLQSRKAEIGYWLAKEYWRRGLMSEALCLILGFGFDYLKLNRIYARVFHPNIASAKLLEKAGFQKEGILRQDFNKQGKVYDLIVFAILKKERGR